MTRSLPIAVLASGRGSNLQALCDAMERGELAAELAVAISNRSAAGALDIARARGVPALHISSRTSDDEGAAILSALREHGARLVVLAGYTKRVDPRILAAFPDRVINIHPAPLPDFGGRGMYGAAVHEAVLQRGARSSGPTVHLVNERYDEGHILAHRSVPVHGDDTPESLARRVLAAEHDLYWRVIQDRFAADPTHPLT